MTIEVNNQRIDSGGSIIELTKQWCDFSDLESRYLGRSNRIQLPKTDNNIRIFGRPDSLGSTNRQFEKFYNVNIIDDSIIFSGIGRLTETNSVYYLDVIETTKLFFDYLGAKLSDLDVDSYDFTYNLTSYNTLKVATSSLWIWPVSSMHENRKNNNFLFSNAKGLEFNRPFFLIQNLIGLIFSEQDWSLTIDDKQDKFPYAVLSSNHKQFFVTDYQKTLTQSISGDGSLTGLDTNDFENITTTSTTIVIGAHQAAFRIRGNITATSEYKIIISAESNTNQDDQEETFIIRSTDTYINLKSNIFKLTNDSSYTISIAVEGTGSLTFENTLLYTIIEEATFGDFTDIEDFYIKTHDNLPDMTQLDLLRNVWKLFGVGFISDSFNKSIDAFTFRKISKVNSLQWSDKFVIDSETITSSIGNYAQNNYLKYSNDDTIDETTGEAFFSIVNETLPELSDVLTLDYSASREVIIDTYVMLDMPVYSDTERINDLTQRIGLYYLDDTSTFSIVYFNPISWANVMNDNYLNIITSLQRTRFITAYFMLNNLDFITFDPTKTIYIEQLEGKFILQRINNYLPGYPTECELLKLE